MTYKRFIRLFFLAPVSIALFLFTANWVVDPFGATDYNLLGIEYKMARDDRAEKIEDIKHAPAFDNLIIGSSRSQHLDPVELSKYLGGSSYNFGVGSGTIEDPLGLLLYLERVQKLPNNVLLPIDFGSFNAEIPAHPSFYKIAELNFLSDTEYKTDYMAKFLSVDAVRATHKTLVEHFKGTRPEFYFRDDGFAVSPPDNNADRNRIIGTTNSYYSYNYSNGNYILSEPRMAYLRQIIALCEKHRISLKVMLTPVHSYHMEMIRQHPKIVEKLTLFKARLAEMTAYWDGMVEKPEFAVDANFEDSVHYTQQLGNRILASIYNPGGEAE